MIRIGKQILALSVFVAGFFVASFAQAASLYTVPEARIFGIGEEFYVDIKIDTEEQSINAAQANLQYPSGVLQAVSVEQGDSVFNFWVEGPTIDKDAGQVIFVGGTPKGLAGSALQVVRVNFRTVGAGQANLTLIDAAITANDGQGSNILSTIENTTIGVGSEVVSQPPPSGEAPQRIERQAIEAEGLPAAPRVRVPLYPEEGGWYSRLGEVTALWDVPGDITAIETRLSRTPDEIDGEITKELFTGKTFGALSEGEWYIRVAFKNNIGWSKPAFYKVGIDTTPPLPFEITLTGADSDNPSPEASFETSDSLSGISHYSVFIDSREVLRTTSSIISLPPSAPGKHTLLIKAVDAAGNSVEDTKNFEVIPLPKPQIHFITDSFAAGETFFASGQAVSNGAVDIRLLNEEARIIFEGQIRTSESGDWEVSIDTGIVRGTYTLVVVARDDRGATSLPVTSGQIKVRDRVIFSLGFVDFGWFEIALIVLLVLIAGGSMVAWHGNVGQERRKAYQIMAGRDVEKMNNVIALQIESIEKQIKKIKRLDPQIKSELAHDIKLTKSTLAKMSRYIKKELEKTK